MTFEDCVKQYPINKTIVGNYWDEGQRFQIENREEIEDVEKWFEPPLEWGDDTIYPFVVYNGFTNEFECRNFTAYQIKGYINQTESPDGFFPATYSDEFGWEIVDLETDEFKDMEIIFPNIELCRKLGEIKGYKLNSLSDHDWKREQVAYLWDPQKYEAGYVFTTNAELKKFVRENF